MIRSVCPHEKIHLLVRDPSIAEYVTGLVRDRKIWRDNLKFHLADYADVWFRDYGPSFVIHPEEHVLAMVDWTFNAWGNKYPDLLDDDTIPMLINKEIGIPRFIPGIVMEGGSIDVNGCGTVLTTEQCLLNPNRNPTLDKPGIEWYLEEYLGCSHVVWLKEGIAGDDTDGHVDDIARFVNTTTILCALEEDPDDENYAPLRENYQVLKRATDQEGKPITVIPIPMPGETSDDTRLPASYANFLITNKVVLLPTFQHPNDRTAATILEGVFPGREVIGIDCRAMVRGLGTLHCISQQQPKP
jgi:agmatine deiminase